MPCTWCACARANASQWWMAQGMSFCAKCRDTIATRPDLPSSKNTSSPPLPARSLCCRAYPKGKSWRRSSRKQPSWARFALCPCSLNVWSRLDDKEGRRKAEKWRSVAREALKQCGSAWLPTVELPMTPNQFLAHNERFELALVASLESGSRPAREYFRALEVEHRQMPKSVGVWVGPEGDFTPAETQAIKSHGVLPITLGRLFLRVETAAIYCLSILNHELQAPAAPDPSRS